jgi:hypothetical protein
VEVGDGRGRKEFGVSKDGPRCCRDAARIVDKRDWTIRPLSVPDDATPALAIHQPGSGRIWIGTAPDGGVVGLAYTDDGGASWTDVELPESLRLTSEALLQSVATPRQEGSLVVAASGDHVAVTAKWDSEPGELFVSADAGATWNTFALSPAYGGVSNPAKPRMATIHRNRCCQRLVPSSLSCPECRGRAPCQSR